MMTTAIERLATELMKLPDEEWARVDQRWRAGLDWRGVFGPAWDEISERLADVERSRSDLLPARDARELATARGSA